jgi:8-oxo-dGTP pyrophosphatase MutT (NUDIX family)
VDARLSILEQTLQQRPAAVLPREPQHREAAVALLLRARADLELLLIKRAVIERDPWSGHMALPGGRRSAEDADLIATAYRETEEEIGVAVARFGHFLGALDEVGPLNPRLPPIVVAPFVVAVPENTVAVPNPAEVEFAVWVPIPALREPGAVGKILISFEGASRTLPSLQYGEHVIWGLTLRILEQFFGLLDTD